MAHLDLALLGPFQAFLDNQPLVGFESNKTRALLAYLAVEANRPHSREALAELLWPEQPAATALANLRHVLANLRRVLDDQHGEPPLLLITAETLQLNPAGDCSVDLAQFQALTTATATFQPTAATYRQAAALYRHPFLHGFALNGCPEFEEWLLLMREQVNRGLVDALAHLAGDAVQQHDYGQAAEWTRQLLIREPWNEEAHRQHMWLLAVAGQRTAALRQFTLCKQVLAGELEVEPQAETVELVERIRRGQVAATEVESYRSRTLIMPARTGAADRLPSLRSPFFGRADELAQIGARLADPDCRLLTVIGPGGVGKTRLAMEAAARHQASFAQGACFVSLVGVLQGEFVANEILQALRAPALGALPSRARLLAYLAGKDLLLVLDNYEHLLEGADLLADLLEAAPGLKLLVTSRVRLNLAAEWLLPLEGLATPPVGQPDDSGAEAVEQQDLERYSAVQLFVHGVRRLQPGFALAPANAPTVVRICRLLEGMPLALELAAAWVRVLPLAEVAVQVAHSLDLLATDLRDVPARHRSMRAVFDHSWRLLSPRERCLLRQLAVFRGGCTREAAAAVAGSSLAELPALVDSSWLRVRPGGRYDLHELVRQYGEEKLAAEHRAVSGETPAAVRGRHGAYFAAFLNNQMQRMNYAGDVMAEVMAEFGNVRVALEWSVAHGSAEAGRDAVAALFFVAEMLGWHHFILQEYRPALAVLEPLALRATASPERQCAAQFVLAWLWYASGFLFLRLGLLERAQDCAARLADLVQHMPTSDHAVEMGILARFLQSWLLYRQGHFADCLQHLSALLADLEGLTVTFSFYGPAVGPKFWQAHFRASAGVVLWRLGRYAEAQSWLRQALALRDEMGEQRFRARDLVWLSDVLRTVGDYDETERCAQNALELSRAFGDRLGVALAQQALAGVEIVRGRDAQAQERAHESLKQGRRSGEHRLLTDSLVLLGRSELAQGHPAAAKAFLDEAVDAFTRLGTAHSNYMAGVWLGLGWVVLAEGNLARARQRFEQVLDARGAAAWEIMEARVGLGAVLLREGQPASAVELLDEVRHAPETAAHTRAYAGALLDRMAACGEGDADVE